MFLRTQEPRVTGVTLAALGSCLRRSTGVAGGHLIPPSVIPAKAGIHKHDGVGLEPGGQPVWIPAFAGMTIMRSVRKTVSPQTRIGIST